MRLEEQHKPDCRRKGLVLIRVGDRFLRPGVVTLAYDFERPGGLVVNAARDQRILGLEVRDLAIRSLQETGPVATRNGQLAVGWGEGELPEETVRITELAVTSDPISIEDGVAAQIETVELERGADALAPIT